MKKILDKLSAVVGAYQTAIQSTEDTRLKVLFSRMREEKQRIERVLFDNHVRSIDVDPSISMQETLSSALQYFRLITARKDKELIDLCRRKEQELYDLTIDVKNELKDDDDLQSKLNVLLKQTESVIRFLRSEEQLQQLHSS